MSSDSVTTVIDLERGCLDKNLKIEAFAPLDVSWEETRQLPRCGTSDSYFSEPQTDFDLEDADYRCMQKKWNSARTYFKCYFSEYFGTLLLMLIVVGACAQAKFTESGNYITIYFGIAAGITIALILAGPNSGAHMNPAITISNAVLRQFPWRRVPGYIVAQISGSASGCLIGFLVYRPLFDKYDHGVRQVSTTGTLFFTMPMDELNLTHQVLSEFVASAVLQASMFSILLWSHRHGGAHLTAILLPLGVFLTVVFLGMAFGVETGYALNPARDLGARIAAVILGYGSEVFTNHNGYAWIPSVITVLGALFGGILFDFFFNVDDFPSPVQQPFFGLYRVWLKLKKWRKVARGRSGSASGPQMAETRPRMIRARRVFV